MPEALDSSCSGYDHSEMWGLVMAGGGHITNSPPLLNVTTTKNGRDFLALANLPDGNSYSCVVIIDEDRIFTCGGYNTESDTLIFSNSTGSWTR